MFGLIGLAFFQEYCKIKALAIKVKENGGVGWVKSFMNSKYRSSLKYKMYLEELDDILSHDN